MSRPNAPATLMAIAFALLFVSLLPAQTTYDAVKDFSLNSNPNGPWSYFDNDVLMTATQTVPGSVIAWGGPMVGTYFEGIGKIISGSTIVGPLGSGGDTLAYPTDHLFITTALGNIAVRFTVPSSGQYTVAGDFLGIESDAVQHAVTVLVNGNQATLGTIASLNQKYPFSFSQAFNTGDVIDFVDDGPSAVSLGYAVGLAATITTSAALPVISSGGIISAGAFGAFTSVAPGSWIEIYGSNLASDTRSWPRA